MSDIDLSKAQIFDVWCFHCKRLAMRTLKKLEPPFPNCPLCGGRWQNEGRYPDDMHLLDHAPTRFPIIEKGERDQN